ncbi:MAG: TRAP transporter TatT component family protein [Rhodocyclaceae bacterium]|nr:TRAP transporter TatT component family protein [Rhodocyclaceae bacterium]
MSAHLRNFITAWFGLFAALFLVGCTPKQLIITSVADALATQSQSAEDDLQLAREASAFYLKLSESVLLQAPGHSALAESLGAGFTQYAYAFVAFDAEQLEAQDAKAAALLRQRAAKLYRRGHQHALKALEEQTPGLRRALSQTRPAEWPPIAREQVGLAYWAAASWGGWISLSKDDPDVVADLPLAIRLAELAWATNPDWGDGTLTSLLGSFEAGRSGGSRARALGYFDQSIAQAQGRNAGAFIAKAEGYAQPAGDRVLFEQLLRQALAVKNEAGSPLALQNEAMRRRAAWLLLKAPDLF